MYVTYIGRASDGHLTVDESIWAALEDAGWEIHWQDDADGVRRVHGVGKYVRSFSDAVRDWRELTGDNPTTNGHRFVLSDAHSGDRINVGGPQILQYM